MPFSTRKTQNLFRTDNPFLFNCEFSNFNVGSIASILNSTYTCATSGRTVQVAEENMASGIAANALPIGKLKQSMPNCLSFDAGATNECIGVIGGTGWANNGCTINSTNNPDLTANARQIIDASAGFASVTRTAYSSDLNVPCYFTVWLRPFSFNNASTNTTYFRRGNGLNATNNNYWSAFYHNQMPFSWQKYYGRINISGYITNTIFVFPAVGVPESSAAQASVGYANCQMQINTAINSEYYDGVLAPAFFAINQNYAISNGQLNLELEFYPKAGSANYGTVYIWYVDSNNYCTYSGSTSKFTVVVNGNSYSPTETFSWSNLVFSGGDVSNTGRLQTNYKVRLYIKCGANTNTIIVGKVDENANVVCTQSAGSQGSLSNSAMYILSSDTTGHLSSHISLIRAARNDYFPEWCR